MNIKRLLSGVLLFPIFAIIMIFGNKYIIDISISIIAIMSLHEFYKAFDGKANPISWVRLYSSWVYNFYTYNTI